MGNREQALEHLRGSGVNEDAVFLPCRSRLLFVYQLRSQSSLRGSRAPALEHLEIFGLDEGRPFLRL